VVFYFAFQLSLGLIFKAFSKDSSDYFRAGGSILWWLVGASAFMTQLSAWTFTGAAGKAYVDGILVAAIFFGNAVGYLGNYYITSYRFRRLRLVTPIEGVRDRFGPANEQVFTWLQVPMSVVYAGIWLNGLGIVASSFFQRPHRTNHCGCWHRGCYHECDRWLLGDHCVGLHADRAPNEHHSGCRLLSLKPSSRGRDI
jgi:Na+/proline symporter|tara:strand:- start:3314 stop:3907 length:594 start_codon:yes stop_codon:yes gene_type:complete